MLCLAAAVVGVPQSQAASPTVVSLTFDDGHASHYSTLPMLQSRGMKGTFYINSDLVGDSSYYMSWPQIQELYDAGNEIGGHTLNHVNLNNVTVSTATREVCDDRANLVDRGLGTVTSFAYPYAAANSTSQSVVESCGYTSGRGVGSLRDDCGGCAYAETIPPANPYRLRTALDATSSTTLAQLQTVVINAENNGGGWVPLVFHGVCASCTGSNSFSPATFTAFLDWLQQRSSGGTVVRTVGEVISGTSTPPPPPPAPITSITCDQAACSTGWYRKTSVSVALTATDPVGSATTTYYTTDGSDPTTSGSRVQYAGPFSVTQTTTVRYYSSSTAGLDETPRSQTVRLDAAAPATSITSPTAGSSIARRTGTVTVSATAQDLGTGSGDPSGIARVVFYDGTTALGTATAPATGTSTYSVSWRVRNAAVRQHTLTAVATDVAGSSTTSAGVTVSITR